MTDDDFNWDNHFAAIPQEVFSVREIKHPCIYDGEVTEFCGCLLSHVEGERPTPEGMEYRDYYLYLMATRQLLLRIDYGLTRYIGTFASMEDVMAYLGSDPDHPFGALRVMEREAREVRVCAMLLTKPEIATLNEAVNNVLEEALGDGESFSKTAEDNMNPLINKLHGATGYNYHPPRPVRGEARSIAEVLSGIDQSTTGETT